MILCNISTRKCGRVRTAWRTRTMTLAQQIEADLRGRAGTGEELPYPLTLHGIAEHFDVSIQPVRTAVDALLEQRLLLRDAARRLTFNRRRGRSRSARMVVGRAIETPDVDSLLTARIVGHSLRGEDVFLREEETAELLGVGRTILRAAFHRMAGAGLIDHVPRRGWRVRAYSGEQMLNYLEVRETLEVRALALARDRLDRKHLQRLLQLNTPNGKLDPRIDNTLHDYWIEQAGNSYIIDFFAQHGKYYAALFDYATLAGSIIEEMAAQHRAMLRALIDGRIADARRALRDHIRAQRPNITRLMADVVEA